MTRIRLLFLCMFAIFAVFAMEAAAGAGSASAAPAECTLAPETSWCFAITSLNTSLLLTEEWSFLSDKIPGSHSILEEPSLTGEKVECGQATDEGLFLEEAPQVEDLTIEFEEDCHIIGNEANCEVGEPILTTDLEGTLVLVGGTGEITFEPEHTTWFATVLVKNKSPNECEQKSELVVRGKQKCLTPNLEEDKTQHILKCETSGSELKNGTKELLFTLEELIFLEGAENTSWGFFQSLD